MQDTISGWCPPEDHALVPIQGGCGAATTATTGPNRFGTSCLRRLCRGAGPGAPATYSPGMAVLLLLLCLGLLIFAATRYDWALVALVVLVIGAMSIGAWVMQEMQGWDGL